MPSVPSVTMNGSMRPLVMSRPCARPKSAPSSSGEGHAGRHRRPSAIQPARGSAFISRIMQPAISAAIEPTERSMPPEMMTKHMPDRDDADEGRAGQHVHRVVERWRNSSLRSVPAMHSSTSPDRAGPDARAGGATGAAAGRGRPRRAAPAAVSVGSGCMGDQRFFGQLVLPAASACEPACRITTTRWQRPISSSSSEEITMTARPSLGQPAGSGSRCRAWRPRRPRASARPGRPRSGSGCSTLASASFCWLPPDSAEPARQ